MDAALFAAAETVAVRHPLPPRIKVLCVGARTGTGAWLAEALSADSASQVCLVEAQGAADCLACVRNEPFDALLICHEPPELDAFDLLDALRGGGCDEPAIVLGKLPEPELLALALESGAEAYLPLTGTTTRALIWTLARAVQHGELTREHRRLRLAERQRLEQEHVETQRLIDEQRSLIRDLEVLRDDACPPIKAEPTDQYPSDGSEPEPFSGAQVALPGPLVAHYQQLLRTHVIMGSGNLGDEIRVVAELLANAGLGAREAMELHLAAVESMVRGLGMRSTRHVMSRADLLALELMVELAEAFRRRWDEQLRPPRQKWLPGLGIAA